VTGNTRSPQGSERYDPRPGVVRHRESYATGSTLLARDKVGREMPHKHRIHLQMNPDLLSKVVLMGSGLVIVVSLLFALLEALGGR